MKINKGTTMKFGRIARWFWIVMAICVSGMAAAQQYPARPIKILIGYSPGGGADTVARVYANKLQDVLGVPVLVENRPGASELIAAQALMTAPPDGYTLWLAGAALTMVPGIRNDLPYDPLKSFAHVSQVAGLQGVFSARNGLPVRSLTELVSYAAANPGKLSYGSAGVGAPGHLMFELLKMATNVDITHIPYKGDADLIRDIVGEGVDVGVVALSVGAPFATEGKVRAIAVTGTARAKGFPNVQTLKETAIKELESIDVWVSFGLVAPGGTPSAVVQKVNEAVAKVSNMPEVVKKLDERYMKPLSGPPAEFRQQVEVELTRWRALGKRLKLTN